jgi:hypothetical protein
LVASSRKVSRSVICPQRDTTGFGYAHLRIRTPAHLFRRSLRACRQFRRSIGLTPGIRMASRTLMARTASGRKSRPPHVSSARRRTRDDPASSRFKGCGLGKTTWQHAPVPGIGLAPPPCKYDITRKKFRHLGRLLNDDLHGTSGPSHHSGRGRACAAGSEEKVLAIVPDEIDAALLNKL